MPDVFVRLREGGEVDGVAVPADGRVRLTPVLVPDGEAWVTSAPTVLDVVAGVGDPVEVSPGRWRVDAVSDQWARRWELDIEESAEPVNLVTLVPVDPATPVPWSPTEDDLLFIRETRERIPELIEEAVAEGDYTGPAGRGIESVTGEDGVATVTFTDGTAATFPLPHGDDGDPGLSAYQVAVAEGFEGTLTEWLESLQGADGPAPDVVWDGSRLVVGGEVGPDLTGPASTVPGPAPTVSWDGPVLVVGGERSPDLTGPAGQDGGAYDSGWRDITGEVSGLTAGSVFVRREGKEVRMALVQVAFTSTGTLRNWWNPPNGFRWTPLAGRGSLNATVGRDGQANSAVVTLDALGQSEIRAIVITGLIARGEVSWLTDQDPPAENNLPGTN